MNNCMKYLELISAYADGELAESDVKHVEDHTAECENCSAFLELCLGISDTVEESCIDAPESLRAGVMEKILSDEMVGSGRDEKKRSALHLVFTRYAPIAACLAIVLLTLPRILDLRHTINYTNNAAAPEAALMMGSSFDMNVDDSDEAWDSFPEEASMETAMAGGGGAVADADDGAPMMTGRHPFPVPTMPGSAIDRGGYAEPETDFSHQTTDQAQESEDIRQSSVQDNAFGNERRPDQGGGALSAFSDDHSWAWIIITGDLPDILLRYTPEPAGDWLGWESVYEIPIPAARLLISEVAGRDDVTIRYINEESEFALVMYSRGE